jgi:hypothetical protein
VPPPVPELEEAVGDTGSPDVVPSPDPPLVDDVGLEPREPPSLVWVMDRPPPSPEVEPPPPE